MNIQFREQGRVRTASFSEDCSAEAKITARVLQMIDAYFMPDCALHPEMSLVDDLGADSLELLEFASIVEEHFNIEIDTDQLEHLLTVRGVCILALRLVATSSAGSLKLKAQHLAIR